MNQEIEKRIWGFVDPFPPIPGSLKDGMFKLINLTEKLCPSLLECVIIELSKTENNMREETTKLIKKIME